MGVLGGVVSTTNESTVLAIDVTATDVYADDSPPIRLYWNPSKTQTVWVAVRIDECEKDRLRDLVDFVSGERLAAAVDCSSETGEGTAAAVEIPPDTAVLVTLPDAAAGR